MRNKILAFFIGLFMALLSLELSLRFFHPRSDIDQSNNANAPFVILCLGNSFTQGSGADTPEGTYPRQLEKKLKEKNFNSDVLVLNGGLVSLNTSELIKKLDFMINKTNPNLIILQIGSANYTNKFGYASSKNLNSHTQKTLFQLHDYFSFFKTYKFAIELFEQKRTHTTLSIEENNARVFQFVGLDLPLPKEIAISVEFAAKAFRTYLSNNQPTKEESINSQDAHFHIGRLTQFLNECPSNKKKEVYNALGQIYFVLIKDYDQAIAQAKQAFLTNSNPMFYSDISVLFDMIKKNPEVTVQQKENIETFLKEQKIKNADAFSSTLALSNSEINQWITEDMEFIIRKIQNRNIKLVLMNYHPMVDSDLVDLNTIIERLAQKHHTGFIDVNKKFKTLWAQGEKREDYHWIFLGRIDNHLNTRGYGVVADTILEQLEREKLLPLSKSL